MMNLDGYPVEPTDPSRLPYNAVGFPIPSYLTGISILLAAGCLIAGIFVDVPFAVRLALVGPVCVIGLGCFLYTFIRAAVHAGLRMNDHDLYIDNSIEAEVHTIQRGHLSPERVAAISDRSNAR